MEQAHTSATQYVIHAQEIYSLFVWEDTLVFGQKTKHLFANITALYQQARIPPALSNHTGPETLWLLDPAHTELVAARPGQ